MQSDKHLWITGIRGIPAQHGGFETFAERLSLYLVEKGWKVTVYCQRDCGGRDIAADVWNGVERISISVCRPGALGTVLFDWKCIRDLMRRREGCILTLGYNTAVFNAILRVAGRPSLINMDGIEWKREKWRWYERFWLWLNERIGGWVGIRLIADHPQIADHLAGFAGRERVRTIPYGADKIDSAPEQVILDKGLEVSGYALVIARPEPENSILEIVRAFSRQERGIKLVLLGRFDPKSNGYHRAVVDSASPEVVFLGAIYEKDIVQSLRFHALLYVHGHQVGGTNPSLVEALGAGCPVLAHDNRFNRWVAGPGARYFDSEDSCALALDQLLSSREALVDMGAASRVRYMEDFTWDAVLGEYESLLSECCVSDR